MQSESTMATLRRRSFLESIFGLFYIMSEGDLPAGGKWQQWATIFLFVVDGMQVLRSLAVSTFSWSSSSISVMQSVDLVALLFHTVQRVLPEWLFYSISILVALGAIVDAGYVLKLLRGGTVKIVWPLKILNMLVASVVTIFFTTVLEFLIYPVRCIDVSNQDNFASALNGSVQPCKPWEAPQLSISIITILVATGFIFFSLLTTFLDFTINPLCRHPLAQCTGRLEALWTLFKVAALLLAYLAPFISAMACSVLLFLLSVGICVYHLHILPFHLQVVNMVRGGIYFAAATFCLASIIIQHHPHRQDLQNWMLGAVPVSFLLGVFVVAQIVSAINRYLGVLRGQFDEQTKSNRHHHGKRGRRLSMTSEGTQRSVMTTVRSMHEQFFDVKWEDDMPFLLSMVTQSLKDHPESRSLPVFHLLLLRYVFQERSQAIAQERLSKMQSERLVLDRSYVLYAITKQTAQEGATENLGKGASSAVNLMEFDQRMEVARKNHRECLVRIKSFWKHVAKRRRKSKLQDGGAGEQASKMSEDLDKFTKAMEVAKQEYGWLHDKYPSSAPLLCAFANFCDHVLNENRRADQLRQQVALMESYGNIDELTGEEAEGDNGGFGHDGGEGLPGGGGDNKSVSTDSEPYRVQMARYMQSWGHLIMSRDAAMLARVQRRVRWAVVCLVALSLISFIVIDFVLFDDVALKTIQDIDETGRFRELAATAPYLLRSEMIEAHRGRTEEYTEIKHYLIGLTKTMQEDHYSTFERISTPAIKKFYEEPNLKVNIPRPFGWEHTKQSFRHLGSDFARRVGTAASAQSDEHDDANFVLEDISQEKRDIAYVFENTIRYVQPCFDQAVAIYEHQMDDFGQLATTLTSVSASVTALLVLILAASVLRARTAVIKRVHSNRVSITLASEIPRAVAVRFYKYFSDLELDMAVLEDDEQDVYKQMTQTDNDAAQRGSLDRASAESVGQDIKPRHIVGGQTVDTRHAAVVEVLSRQLSAPPTHGWPGADDEDDDEAGTPSKLTSDNLHKFLQRSRLRPESDIDAVPPAVWHDAADRSAEREREDDERGGGGDVVIGNDVGESESSEAEQEQEQDGDGGKDAEGNEEERDDSPHLSLSNLRQAAIVLVSRERQGPTQIPTRDVGQKGFEITESHNTGDPKLSEQKPRDSSESGQIVAANMQRDETLAADDTAGEESPLRRKIRGSILRLDSETEGLAPASSTEVGSPLRAEKSLRFAAFKGGNGADAVVEELPVDAAERQEEDGMDADHDEQGQGCLKPQAQPLALQEMPAEMHAALAALQYRDQPWFNRWQVYAATLAVLLVLCMLYALYPVRHIPAIVTMAPTMDKATERMSLARACIFLARELVLQDSLARMTQGEISGTLDMCIHKYEEADRAVRLGDKTIGIETGADDRSSRHNEIMYKSGCLWRQQRRSEASAEGEGDTACSLPNSTYTRAAGGGLFNLQSAFLESLHTILKTYGTSPGEYVDTYSKHREDHEDVSAYTHIPQDERAYSYLTNDPDIVFLDLMFDGDLHVGLEYMVVLFEHETKALLDLVHLEMRLLFGLYMAFLLLGFYSLFLRTARAARAEVSRAHEFARTLPLHALGGEEAAAVKAFYMRDSGMQELHDDGNESDG